LGVYQVKRWIAWEMTRAGRENEQYCKQKRAAA
jgi:hypothetical protein